MWGDFCRNIRSSSVFIKPGYQNTWSSAEPKINEINKNGLNAEQAEGNNTIAFQNIPNFDIHKSKNTFSNEFEYTNHGLGLDYIF